MDLTITNSTCEDIIYNGHYLEKLYFNEDLVWEKIHHDYSQDYFTIKSLEDDNVVTLHQLQPPSGTEEEDEITYYYSTDKGASWVSRDFVGTSWTLNKGQTVMIRANARRWGNIWKFSSTKKFNVMGNILSLLYSSNFKSTITLPNSEFIFTRLFKDAEHLVDASNLILPSTFLRNFCYDEMFAGCTSLEKAPELPATYLADYCYEVMFAGCTSLAQAPQLPSKRLARSCYYGMFSSCTSLVQAPQLQATNLSLSCYDGMFYGCSSLIQAPELPATTLAQLCYYRMFYGCSSLNYVKCLATDISALYCVDDWLDGTAASGTFIKASSNSSWPSGSSGIPSGWTVQNA